MVRANESDKQEITRHVNHLMAYHAKYFRDNDVSVADGVTLMIMTYSNTTQTIVKDMDPENQIVNLKYQLSVLDTVVDEFKKRLVEAEKNENLSN